MFEYLDHICAENCFDTQSIKKRLDSFFEKAAEEINKNQLIKFNIDHEDEMMDISCFHNKSESILAKELCKPAEDSLKRKFKGNELNITSEIKKPKLESKKFKKVDWSVTETVLVVFLSEVEGKNWTCISNKYANCFQKVHQKPSQIATRYSFLRRKNPDLMELLKNETIFFTKDLIEESSDSKLFKWSDSELENLFVWVENKGIFDWNIKNNDLGLLFHRSRLPNDLRFKYFSHIKKMIYSQ